MEFISSSNGNSCVSQAVYGFDFSQIEKGYILTIETIDYEKNIYPFHARSSIFLRHK